MTIIGRTSGFTLVEAALTIVILAVVSVVAIPYFTDVGAVTADAGAQKVLGDLSYVRRLAKNRNGYYGISFDAAAETYTVYQCNGSTTCTAKTTMTDPTTQASMAIDFKKLPGLKGIDIQTPSFGGTTEIRFDAQGFPRNASNALLTGTGSVKVSRGGTIYTIVVQPNTGEVSIQ